MAALALWPSTISFRRPSLTSDSTSNIRFHGVRRVEDAERFGKKFDQAFELHADSLTLDSDALGPASTGTSDIRQEGTRSVDDYMAEAKRLQPLFTTRVLDVLAAAASTNGMHVLVKSGLKGKTRAEEKIRNDYSGDASKVKDYLRACLICFDMPEVCRVCDALNELAKVGEVEIKGIKNR